MRTTLRDIEEELQGQRIEAPFSVCLYCNGRDGVLRKHHCKTELELYCDWCERWTGIRISIPRVLALVESGEFGADRQGSVRALLTDPPLKSTEICPG